MWLTILSKRKLITFTLYNLPDMLKKSVVLVLLVFSIIGCKEVEIVEIVPDWLQKRIDSTNGNCAFYGSTATRYFWDTMYVYEINIPISPCYLCDVHDGNGVAIKFDSASAASYIKERTGKTVVWSFKDVDCLR